VAPMEFLDRVLAYLRVPLPRPPTDGLPVGLKATGRDFPSMI